MKLAEIMESVKTCDESFGNNNENLRVLISVLTLGKAAGAGIDFSSPFFM